jgi:PAS domain S-box-containing protein
VHPLSPNYGVAFALDITERKKARDKLLKSEAQKQAILDGISANLAFVNERLEIQWLNRSAAESLGRSASEILGHTCHEFWADPLKPCDGCPTAKAFQTKKSEHVEMITPDGRVWDAKGEPVFGPDGSLIGVIEIAQDITQRRKAEEDLRKSEEKYRQLVNNLNVGVFTTDLKGRFLNANLAATKIVGYDDVDELLMAVPTSPFYADPSDRPRLLEGLLQKGFLRDHEVRFLKKDGASQWVSITAILQRDEEGRPCAISGILEDISERKTLREALIQSEKFRAVADLTAGVAHNFNNLLQIVMGNAELASMWLQSGNVGQVNANLAQIIQSSRLGADTVKRLQRYSHGDGQREVGGTTVFDLSDVATEAVNLSKPWLLTQTKKDVQGVTISLNLQEEATIRGDRAEMFEVIVNLIKNAAEAILESGNIMVETSVEGEHVLLCVKDTGIGIPEVNLGRLFTPFFTTNTDMGRGLGLAACKRIVDAHGGSIHVDSVEGRGTAFTVRLLFVGEPLKRAEVPKTEITSSELSILVVDDVEAMLEVLHEGLAQFGHSVRTALSGVDALKILTETSIDLIICDLGMPRMDGWQLCRAVHKMAEMRVISKPYFIILTGWDEQGLSEDKIAESGVDAVIHKPIDMKSLIGVIEEVSQRRRQ